MYTYMGVFLHARATLLKNKRYKRYNTLNEVCFS